MKIRRMKKEDKKQVIKILIQMQELHRKGRKDIFKRTTKKEVKNEFLKLLNENEKQTIVAEDRKNKVRGLAYCKY